MLLHATHAHSSLCQFSRLRLCREDAAGVRNFLPSYHFDFYRIFFQHNMLDRNPVSTAEFVLVGRLGSYLCLSD